MQLRSNSGLMIGNARATELSISCGGSGFLPFLPVGNPQHPEQLLDLGAVESKEL